MKLYVHAMRLTIKCGRMFERDISLYFDDPTDLFIHHYYTLGSNIQWSPCNSVSRSKTILYGSLTEFFSFLNKSIISLRMSKYTVNDSF